MEDDTTTSPAADAPAEGNAAAFSAQSIAALDALTDAVESEIAEGNAGQPESGTEDQGGEPQLVAMARKHDELKAFVRELRTFGRLTSMQDQIRADELLAD
jgi:hypothetical protein